MIGQPPAPGLSNGARLVLSFVALAYALPAAAYLVMDPEVNFRCPVERADVWAHMAIATACIVSGAVAAGRGNARTAGAGTRGIPVAAAAIAVAAIAVSVPALLSGASARYGSESLSEQLAEGQGGAAIAVVVLQAVAPLLAWWMFLQRQDLWFSRSLEGSAFRWTLAAATVACINGLSSAARAAVALAMIAWPSAGGRLLFAGTDGRSRTRGLVVALAGFAVVAVALASVGLRAKTGSTGSDEAWERYSDPAYLVGRNSVHFQHAMAALEIGIDEGDRTPEFLDRATIAFEDVRFRTGVLTGNPSWGTRPDPSSLSRFTFERFALFEPSERMSRGGSSPSVIGAFALSLPPPWSFAAMAAFAFAMVRWLDWLLAGTPRLSWIGCAIIAFGPLRVLTDTPTNLPNPFGIPFIVVALATVARLLSPYAVPSTHRTAHERPT